MQTGYMGTGVWVRVRHRFGPRKPEWFMSAHMVALGLILLLPAVTFNQPAFRNFEYLFYSEDALGWVLFSVGILRAVGLFINGAREKVTPQIRQFSAAIGCLIWVGISYGFYSSDVVSTWMAIYPLFAGWELVNIRQAAQDEGEIRNARAAG